MLYYDRIDAFEGIDINKIKQFEGTYAASSCYFWCETEDDIAILNIKGVDYRCIMWNMSKSNAVNRLNNYELYVKDWL